MVAVDEAREGARLQKSEGLRVGGHPKGPAAWTEWQLSPRAGTRGSLGLGIQEKMPQPSLMPLVWKEVLHRWEEAPGKCS